MNEDARLNAFLKERLEADVPGETPRLEAILHAASAAAQARAAARRRSASSSVSHAVSERNQKSVR